MEPITVLTYIVISHYGCYIITNFYDYIKFQSNFRSIENKITMLENKINRL
jgi:hypothetical protein